MSVIYNIVSIEGNIGSGKSTLLAFLKEQYKNNENIIFLKEPVDQWNNIKDEDGVTILEKFYKDQNKYSFPFQMMAYITRLKLFKDTVTECNKKFGHLPNHHITIITERSLYTDKMVFAKMLYDDKKIEHINYTIYLNWFDTFAKDFNVNKIIYVKADPTVCYNRIAIRQRDGEDNIPLDYLITCDKYHKNMLDKSSEDCVCNDQLVLDGNVDIYKNKDVLNEWINSIQSFIKI